MASYPLRFPIEAGDPGPINRIADAIRKASEHTKLSTEHLALWGKAVQGEIDRGYSFAKSVNTVNAALKGVVPGMDAFTERLKINVREQEKAEAQAKRTHDAYSRLGVIFGARTAGVPLPFGAQGAIASAVPPGLVGGIAGAAGLVAVGDAMLKLATHAGEYARQMTNLSEKTGLSVRDTQLFSRASEVAGVNIQSLVAQVRTLSKALSENSDEGRKAKQALKELGLDQSVAFQNPASAIQTIYQRLSTVPNSFDKERIASTLFGRGGLESLPVAGELGGLSARIRGAGAIVSDADIKSAKEFNDTLKVLGITFDSLKIKAGSLVGRLLAPVLQGLSQENPLILASPSNASLYAASRATGYSPDDFGLPLQGPAVAGRGGAYRPYLYTKPGTTDPFAFMLSQQSEAIQRILNSPGPGISGQEHALRTNLTNAQSELSAAADKAGGSPGASLGPVQSAKSKVDAINAQILALKQAESLREAVIKAQEKELTGIEEINAAYRERLRHMQEEGSLNGANLKLAQQIRDTDIDQFRKRQQAEQALNTRQVGTAIFGANRSFQSASAQGAYRIALAQGRYEDSPAATRSGIAAAYGISMQGADTEFALASREVQDLRAASAARERIRPDAILLAKEQTAIREAQIRASYGYAGTAQRAGIERQVSTIDEDRHEKALRDAGDREIRNQNLGYGRDLAGQRSRLAVATGTGIGAAAPTASQAISNAYTQRLDLARQIADVEIRSAAALDKADDKRVAINKAIIDYKKSAGDAEVERAEKIAQLEQKAYDQDQARAQSLGRGGFDALVSGGGGLAFGQFLRSKLIGFGSSVAGNLAGIASDTILPGGLHPSAGFAKAHPTLSRALHGTAFEPDPTGGLQVAGTRLTAAASTLDTAGQALLAAAFRAAGLPVPSGVLSINASASPGAASLAGAVASAPYTPLPMYSPAAGGLGAGAGLSPLVVPAGGYSPVSFDGGYSPISGSSLYSPASVASGVSLGSPAAAGGIAGATAPSSVDSVASKVADIASRAANLAQSRSPNAIESSAVQTAEKVAGLISKSPKVAKDLGAAAQIAGGGVAAYEGFHMGGPQGTLEAGAGIAGAAAGIMALAGVTGPAAPIVAGVGALLGLSSAIMGDPRTRRQNTINKRLQTYSFYTPAALSVNTSIGGFATAYDSSGNLRQVNGLNPYPTVQEPYISRGVMVPGRTTSPVGAAGPGTTINIQAMDSQSFSDYLMNNADPVAAATVASIGQSGGQGLVEMMRAYGAGG